MPVNSDLTKFTVVCADDVAWETTEIEGIHCKTLERVLDTGLARETCLYKLDPGATFPSETLDERIEVFVIYGKFSDGTTEVGKYNYLRIPPGSKVQFRSETGCVIFFRRREERGSGGTRFSIDIGDSSNFEAWGERGSEKVPLEDPTEPSVGAWVGRMIPDLHIPNHDHANGEEIFILEGVIEDEYCAAGPRTWLRFPIGFRHAPFSQHNDVLMLVREGDVKV